MEIARLYPPGRLLQTSLSLIPSIIPGAFIYVAVMLDAWSRREGGRLCDQQANRRPAGGRHLGGALSTVIGNLLSVLTNHSLQYAAERYCSPLLPVA